MLVLWKKRAFHHPVRQLSALRRLPTVTVSQTERSLVSFSASSHTTFHKAFIKRFCLLHHLQTGKNLWVLWEQSLVWAIFVEWSGGIWAEKKKEENFFFFFFRSLKSWVIFSRALTASVTHIRSLTTSKNTNLFSYNIQSYRLEEGTKITNNLCTQMHLADIWLHIKKNWDDAKAAQRLHKESLV